MKAPVTLVAFGLVSFGRCMAAARTDQENLGSWTLSNFRRYCLKIENRCDISFDLAENKDEASAHCTFAVTGTDDIPAMQMESQDAKCDERADYRISSSWDKAGFSVFVINNDAQGLMSFFSFQDEELSDGAVAEPKSRKVLRTSPAEAEGDEQEEEDGEEEPQQEKVDLNYAEEWTLTDVTRVPIQGKEQPTMALTFNVEHPSSERLVCVVMGHGQPGDDAKTMSFYAASCGDSDWTVSWGYDHGAEEDVAIMTLMNKYHDRRAYFGFRHVNDGLDLGDNGPEQTYPF